MKNLRSFRKKYRELSLTGFEIDRINAYGFEKFWEDFKKLASDSLLAKACEDYERRKNLKESLQGTIEDLQSDLADCEEILDGIEAGVAVKGADFNMFFETFPELENPFDDDDEEFINPYQVIFRIVMHKVSKEVQLPPNDFKLEDLKAQISLLQSSIEDLKVQMENLK